MPRLAVAALVGVLLVCGVPTATWIFTPAASTVLPALLAPVGVGLGWAEVIFACGGSAAACILAVGGAAAWASHRARLPELSGRALGPGEIIEGEWHRYE